MNAKIAKGAKGREAGDSVWASLLRKHGLDAFAFGWVVDMNRGSHAMVWAGIELGFCCMGAAVELNIERREHEPCSPARRLGLRTAGIASRTFAIFAFNNPATLCDLYVDSAVSVFSPLGECGEGA